MTATAALSGPRAAVVQRSASTYQLPVAFDEVDELLAKEIDPLLVRFKKKTEPAFYADYQAARIIIDRPGGRSDPEPDPAKTAAGAKPAAT